MLKYYRFTNFECKYGLETVFGLVEFDNKMLSLWFTHG